MASYKTHSSNDITQKLTEKDVILSGWVHRRRDHGGVIFIDLRDSSGICQIVFRENIASQSYRLANQLRAEYVIKIGGKVIFRDQENINPKLPTGEMEVEVHSLEVLSRSKTPVFEVTEDEIDDTSEEVKLRYRYLDLRKKTIKNNLIKRSDFLQAMRLELHKNNFLEIETPILNKATPEGARDFLVPSRLNQGNFYALPQSPQIFKQILMMSGIEKYYQIARCFRDEDLRSDRQPEFTQIDLEMAFVTKNEVMSLCQSMLLNALSHTFPEKINKDITIQSITYAEAMQSYGTDRPDTRFDMKIINVEAVIKQCEFKVFRDLLDTGKGIVRALCVKKGEQLSRKDIDNYTTFVNKLGAKGLAWMRVTHNGLESNIVKFFNDDIQQALLEKTQANPGDLLFFLADTEKIVLTGLGKLRLDIAHRLKLFNQDQMNFLWIYDFPLLEYDAISKKWQAVHHPFTMPRPKDIPLLKEDPASVLSEAYDLVLNGVELGGGSIRNYDHQLQMDIFHLLSLSESECKEKFGFFLDALQYGAPPHGGIAFGLDRIIAVMQNCNSIRDVIAFPKTQSGQCLLSQSPTAVEDSQLLELNLKLLDI